MLNITRIRSLICSYGEHDRCHMLGCRCSCHRARAAGLVVSRGRLGRVAYRDPRFDTRRECRDCHGSGRCPLSGETEGCLTCGGVGVVTDQPSMARGR